MLPDPLRTKQELSPAIRIVVVLSLFIAILTILNLGSRPSGSRVLMLAHTTAPEIAQVFYRSSSQDYSQNRSRTITLENGLHEHSFRITPASYNLSGIRLDPSRDQTELRVERLAFEWDGKLVFDLTKNDLLSNLKPVQDVIVERASQGTGVLVKTTGIDPILEVDAGRSISLYRAKILLKNVGIALLMTVIFLVPFVYMTSDRYIAASHFTYPAVKSHWLLWALIFLFIGMFLTVVTPVSLDKHKPVIHFLAVSFSVGAFLFTPAFWLCTRELIFAESRTVSRFSWLWYALPFFMAGTFYLFSYWPGSLSPDSIDQWRQVVKLSFKDWHPVFHTLNLWLVTRVILSPVMVVAVQILAIGTCVGWTLSVLERYGIPRAVLWVTALLAAVLPINSLMAITLWKDIAYSIVLVVLSMYLFMIVMEKGEWLRRPRNLLQLGLVIALVSLYRHNGIVPAVFTCIVLLLSFRKYWKQLAAVSLLAFIMYAGIKGPLYEALDVKRGDPLSKTVKKLEKKIRTHSDQKESRDHKVERDAGPDERKENQYKEIVTDRVYSASRLWRIKPMDFFHKRIEYVNLWQEAKGEQLEIRYVSSNKFGIEEKSLLPAGKKTLYQYFEQTRYNTYLFWMWRPAVYLYLLTGVIVLLSYRFRNNLYLVLTPSIVNSLPIFLIVIHKSVFRYHYPVVLLGMLLILPLMFLRPTLEETKR